MCLDSIPALQFLISGKDDSSTSVHPSTHVHFIVSTLQDGGMQDDTMSVVSETASVVANKVNTSRIQYPAHRERILMLVKCNMTLVVPHSRTTAPANTWSHFRENPLVIL
jgi:hypothetical protein